jgi:transcriptional regulator with XRE-family HTH domain
MNAKTPNKKAVAVRKPARAKAAANATEPPKVGATIARLRQQRQLSLDDLSREAGVSKSMLSQIERNQANPTVALVWRLSVALHVPMSELISGQAPAAKVIETVAAHATPMLATQDKRCALRILSPLELAGQFEWYELTIAPGGALVSQPHEPGSREHLTVLSGTMEVQSSDATQKLNTGETARYAVDVAHAIRNTTKTVASALLVVIHA